MKKILIVEDNPVINLFYSKIFTVENGWEATMTITFEHALEELHASDFDYVISDGTITDSSMTGIDFLKEVSTKKPQTIRFFISGSITPKEEDFKNFNAFIDKKDLKGVELLEIMDFMAKDDKDTLSDQFCQRIYIG